MAAEERPISKKKKFVRDGIFYAELNELLTRELAEDGYAGVEVRLTPARTEIVVFATQPQNVVGKQARRVKELTALIEKRFNFQPDSVNVYAESVKEKALSALAQAEAVKFRLSEGLSVRRAANSVLRFIMENRNARGCEIIVTGKLRGQRAKGMKFKEGYMICSGDAKNYYIDEAVKHLCLRQGVLGIKVKIMLAQDPTGEHGPVKDLPDKVTVLEPKEHKVFAPEQPSQPEPESDHRQYDEYGFDTAQQYPQEATGDFGAQNQPAAQDTGYQPEMGYSAEQPAQGYEDQAGGYQATQYEEPSAQAPAPEAQPQADYGAEYTQDFERGQAPQGSYDQQQFYEQPAQGQPLQGQPLPAQTGYEYEAESQFQQQPYGGGFQH